MASLTGLIPGRWTLSEPLQVKVDSGVRSRGHRKNIFNQGFGVAGISHGAHARFGSVCVISFAGNFQATGAVGRSTGHRSPWHAERPLFKR